MTAVDLKTSDPALTPIAQKVANYERLSLEDGQTLYASRDIHSIGRLANHVRTRLHNNRTYFNRNRHINYTNICALSCKFCSFYRKKGEDGAYEMPVEQVVATAAKAAAAGATEVHIVGGLHPWLKFDYYTDMLSGIRAACPSLHIKAFTAIEIIHLSRIARMSVREVLIALRDAGLGSLPGGGAEIFDDRVHDEVFKGKVREDRWFEVHRTAHELGIYTNATMLYGHVETPAQRIGHMIKLRELQDESLARSKSPHISDESPRSLEGDGRYSATSRAGGAAHLRSLEGDGRYSATCGAGGAAHLRSLEGDGRYSATCGAGGAAHLPAHFNCVIPLSFIPENSELGYLPGPTGLTDLKTLAIARLMIDNIPHIKAFWIMQSLGLSQLALNYGCDDLDGTVVWYDITKREGQGVHQELHVDDIKRLIREAGKDPVERDTLYRTVERNEQDAVVEVV
jgi:aminodeoxyfutalosine synthase